MSMANDWIKAEKTTTNQMMNSGANQGMSSMMDSKRRDLAKRKQQIISGQNNRVAYGNAPRIQTSKNGVISSGAIGL